MNIVRVFTTALVGTVASCVLSAGAASAQPVPYVPAAPQVSSPSLIAVQQGAAARSAKDHAQLLLKQKAYIDHVQDAYAAKEAAQARSRAAQKHARVSHGGSLVAPADQGATSNGSSRGSGDGSEVPVLAVTALAGLALGAAGSTASRRLRRRPRLAA